MKIIEFASHGRFCCFGGIALAAFAFADPAAATVTISGTATKNMACSEGVCSPTAANAVLNVGDLQNDLASGSLAITTTGPGVQATDIVVAAGFSWASSNTLTLDAFRAITVNKPVSVTGHGGLTLTTNDGRSGGVLSFRQTGRVSFADMTSSLVINGGSYVLVNSVRSLINAIPEEGTGNYAFANNYNAKQDGKYSGAPIRSGFWGNFDGLGNTISHLSVKKGAGNQGLFALVEQTGVVADIGLADVAISGDRAGGLVGYNQGTIRYSHTSGHVKGGKPATVGGLVGINDITGIIVDCYSTASVVGRVAGGLIGGSNGTISSSFATGPVSFSGGGSLGGLVGYNDLGTGSTGTITNSYATGAVGPDFVGGLVGYDRAPISTSYSTGAVTGFHSGGFLGGDDRPVGSDDYWDTTTSGTKTGVGAGSAIGITGLTSQQLQAGLPQGFDAAIWGQDPNINTGFPYLLSNPPPR